MGEVYHRRRPLPALPPLGTKLVGIGRPAVHFRQLHYQEDTLDVVEVHSEGPVRMVMSWVDALDLCPRGCLFHQPLPVPKLRHSLLFLREEPPHGRLPRRLQGELRTAHPADTAHHAAYPAYHAGLQLQELHRVASLGLPPCEGSGTRRTQRHRRLQLSCWRLPAEQRGLSGSGLLPDGL